MRWKITIEGLDEFGGRGTTEMVIEKDFSRLSKGEIGLSIADGKSIMACLQQFVVKQPREAYVMTNRYCTDGQTFRRVKDYSKRKIRTVYGRVKVISQRNTNCLRAYPIFSILQPFCAISAPIRRRRS